MIESWRSAVAAGDPGLAARRAGQPGRLAPHYPRLRAVFSHTRSRRGRGVQPRRQDRRHRRRRRHGAALGRRHLPARRRAPAARGRDNLRGLQPRRQGRPDRQHDRTARLWDAATGRPLGGPSGTRTRWSCGRRISPDGATVLTGCLDGTVRLWDAAIGQPSGPLVHHGLELYTVAPAPTGKIDPHGERRRPCAALGRRDRPARPADARHRRLSFVQPALSPDGTTSSTGTRTARCSLGRDHRPTPLIRLNLHADRVRAWPSAPTAGPSSPGADDKTARLWDAATRQPIGRPLHSRRPGRGRGVQPRRPDLPHREQRPHGAAVGRRHPPAARPAAR